MQMPLPLSKEIVLIGGGHAHALLLRRWGMNPLPGARLTVINPAPTAPYTGMLPGHVEGYYPREALEIDLVRLARFAGARVILGWATGIDRDARLVHVGGRAPVAYDIASIDIGITSEMADVPGFAEHAIAAKPLGPFAARWRDHLDGDAGDCVVIGGGVAGVELALTMAFALKGRGSVAVVEAETALRGTSPATRSKLLAEVEAASIALHENARVARVEADAVLLDDGRRLPATLTVGAAGARPFPWLEETGLTLENGYIAVDEHLRSINDPNIFAAGDCAHLTQAPRPKAGVFAVRAAPVLTHNLAAAASREPLKAFHPQARYLKLITLGGERAVTDKWGIALSGEWVWRWKDRIDRAFMEKLAKLPRMKPPPLPLRRAAGVAEARGPKPLCGGCGAKIGSGALDRVLDGLPATARDDVVAGSGDDAAVLAIGGKTQVITTDHLRAFWDDPYVFSRIVALHALGDVWAMGAAPQAALVQVTLPPLAPALQEGWLAEIMAAASEVFAAEGAAIVGGHSTQGAEFTLGFTVTGIAEQSLVLGGAEVGDALVLTRPIGSGTIMAAEMAGDARGDDIAALLETLTRGQGDAARYLAPQAHAMTDVTGFGLAGHAARMAAASGVTAVINPAQVPVFDGALELAGSGVRSSIWSANRDAVAIDADTDDARTALLFDPQTAGGFLASLPENKAADAVKALAGMGHESAIVGRIDAFESGPLKLVQG